MRATEVVLTLFSSIISKKSRTPVWYSARLWFLKLGFYKLHRPKPQAQDWVWFVDHIVQAGNLKCFVVLGMQAKDFSAGKALSREDMEPLGIIPMETSNGKLVFEQLKSIAMKYGAPKAIVADHGSDIKLGIKLFCKCTHGTLYLYDIKHCMASLLKAEFESNGVWKSYLELAATTKKYLQQTGLAGLMPPNQRSKARYMNLEAMISWGNKILKHLDSGEYPSDVDIDKLRIKLGWLPFFRQDLKVWGKMMERVIHTESYLRLYGYFKGVTSKLEADFRNLPTCLESYKFQQKILQAVFTEEQKLKDNTVLPASTEILESLFGSFKYFAKEQSQSGFTVSVLAIASMLGKATPDVIKAASEETRVHDLKKWADEQIGQSVQAQRIAWLGNKKEQKVDEKSAA